MADTQVKNETVLAALDGNERIYCVDDPTGTPADRYLTPELLGPTRQIPYFADSNSYLITPNSAAMVGGNVAANRLHMTPVWVPYRKSFTTLAVVCTALAASAAGARLGIYNSSQAGQPTTLIAEGAAPIDVSNTSATGIKTATIAQTLNPGMYYLAYVTDVAHSIIRMIAAANISCMGGVFAATSVTANNSLYRAYTYAALPADETAQTYTTIASLGSSGPCIGIR